MTDVAAIGAVTRLTAKPGGRAELIERLAPFLRAMEARANVQMYAAHVDEVDADVVWFYTLFPSEEARARHRASEAAMTAELAELVAALGATVDQRAGMLLTGGGFSPPVA